VIRESIMPVTACWNCKKEIDPADSYCRFCGKGQGRHVPLQYRPWVFTLLTLFALGPLTLPYVWKSPFVSRTMRWVHTAWICAYSAMLIMMLIKSYNIISSSLSAAQDL